VSEVKHIPVMLRETVEALSPKAGGVYLDCTCGGGGHAGAILEASAPDGKLLGMDRDGEAVARCQNNLGYKYGKRVKIVHSEFSGAAGVVAAEREFCGAEKVDGVIMDLGVSSFQLDEAERGFSFSSDGPLSMRMDTSKGRTAEELLDSFGNDYRAFAKVLRDFGEEPDAVRLGRAILTEHVREPIRTTSRLASVIERVVGGRRGPKHPATLVFQALRMAVNNELDEVGKGVEAAIGLLRDGGRLAVISFHSLEDRLVKGIFSEHEGRMVSLQQGGAEWVGKEPRVRKVNKHVITPGERETKNNPRSRSAKLRIVERF